jgi:membrane-associated phospholipid phosphatase
MDPITSYIAHLELGPFTQLAFFFHNYAYALVAILSLITVPYFRKKNIYYALAFSMVLVIAASLLLKDAYSVPRPCNSWLPEAKACVPPDDYGLPSGHSAFAFLFVAASLGTVLFPVYLTLWILVAFSRVYLGLHSIADVGGGVVLGMMTYLVVEELLDFWARKRGRKQW